MMLEFQEIWVSSNNLFEEIRRLKETMERLGRVKPLSSRELLQLSERLDLLINEYMRDQRRAVGTTPASGGHPVKRPDTEVKLNRRRHE